MTYINKVSSRIKSGARFVFLHLPYLSDYAPSPRGLIIAITDDCNLNCPMCPRSFSKVTGENMPLEKFKCILDQFPKVRHVALLSRGETLMNPNLFEMLNIGKFRNIHFRIVTNGTLLTEKNIRRLNNVSIVEVSIDHPHPEGYKKIRGVNLEIIINNLRRLKHLRKEIYLCIQALIMEDNIEDLPEFITLAHNVGADKVNLIHLIAFDQKLYKKHGDNFKAKLEVKIQEAKERAKQFKVNLAATPLLQKPRHCFQPWSTLRISLNGDIYPCCFIYNTSEQTWEEWYQDVCLNVPQFKYKMGNIFEDSFERIWNGNDYRLLRKTVRKSEEHNLLSPEELNKRRKENNLNERFSYCQVCLFRQNRAC